MHRRDQRRAHMGDERDPACPKARIGHSARDVVAKLGREFAGHGRDVDPDLFEHAPTHDRDGPAATAGALPRGTLEPANWTILGMLDGKFVLDCLECRANVIAQRRKPRRGAVAPVGVGGKGGGLAHGDGNMPVCRNASASATAPARATLSDRAGEHKGITMRAAAAECTAGGTPALSRPSRIVSLPSNVNRWSATAPEVVINSTRDRGSRLARNACHDAWRTIGQMAA